MIDKEVQQQKYNEMLAEGIHPNDIVKEEHYVDVEDLMQKKMEAMEIASRNQGRGPFGSSPRQVA